MIAESMGFSTEKLAIPDQTHSSNITYIDTPGNYIGTDLLPYNYIFIWILISTPLLYTVFFVIGYTQMFKRKI